MQRPTMNIQGYVIDPSIELWTFKWNGREGTKTNGSAKGRNQPPCQIILRLQACAFLFIYLSYLYSTLLQPRSPQGTFFDKLIWTFVPVDISEADL